MPKLKTFCNKGGCIIWSIDSFDCKKTCAWVSPSKINVFKLHLFKQDEGHTEWVSCVRFSPNSSNPIIVSAGWDKIVKVFLYFAILLSWLAVQKSVLTAIQLQLYCISCVGLEPDKLPSEDQPLWTHRVSELCDCVTRWLVVCFGWKGRYGHAVGLEWGKTFVHPWWRRYPECPVFQSKQILAVRRSRTKHQGLGKLKTV